MPEILKCAPAFKDYLWGGDTLKKLYGVHAMEKVAEAWVLSCHPDGPSTVDGGPLAQKTLPQALQELGPAALGSRAARFPFFPQLIKLIDAKDRLSVQVHPSDAYALEHEKQFGKTEMWIVLDAKPGAGIYYGFQRPVSKEEFRHYIESQTLPEILNFVPAKKGDCFFIPSGTVHAIGAGLLIAEIQQNSNVTYRVYDYGRVGADGKQRPLHIEQAIAVSHTDVPKPQPTFAKQTREDAVIQPLAQCDYFTVDRITLNGTVTLTPQDSFLCVLVLEGSGQLNGRSFAPYDCFFIPADVPSCRVCGNAVFLTSRV